MKSSKTQLGEFNERLLSWRIFGPKLIPRLPRTRSMIFQFKIVVKNKSEKNLLVKVQMESPSNILVFQSQKLKTMAKSRLYEKITTLLRVIDEKITCNEERAFNFPVEYRPHITSSLPSVFALYYGIFAYDENNQIQARFGPRKIDLPIAHSLRH